MSYNFVHALNNYLDIAGIANFSSKFSISVWVNIAATPANNNFHTIFGIGVQSGGDQRNYTLDYRQSGSVIGLQDAWTTTTNNYTGYFKTTTLATNTWIHLCDTVDWTTNPDTVQLYVDGVAQNPSLNTGTNNTTPQTTGTGAKIGAMYDVTNGWGGDLAELAMWTDAITADDAAALAKGYSAKIIHPASQFFYAPLIRPLVDIRLLNNVVSNGPSVSAHAPIRNP